MYRGAGQALPIGQLVVAGNGGISMRDRSMQAGINKEGVTSPYAE